MAIIALKLTPLDVLFFRDARPFDQADSAGSGLPTPQSFYGLIKTYLATINKLPFSKLHGLRRSNNEKRWISEIRTRGVWLFRGEGVEKSIFVPVPSDIVQLAKSAGKFSRLRPVTVEEGVAEPVPGWNDPYGLRPLWSNSEESPRAAAGFLNQTNLQEYLEGKFTWTKNDIVAVNELYEFESRVGIGVNAKTMVAADSQIYSASFLRLKEDISFYGEIEIDESKTDLQKAFEMPITLPWGGEGRRVHVEKCEPVIWPSSRKTSADGRLLSLLITPGIFGSRDVRGQNGHGPEPQPLWKPRELGTLTAASVPRPTPISGWNLSGRTDLADSDVAVDEHDEARSDSQPYLSHGCPRPTRYAAPAGSVYFWKRGKNNRSDKAGKEIQPLESLCGKPMEADAGWGLSLTGIWKPFDEIASD